MKIDDYVKFLLAIITLCLLYLSLKSMVQVPKVQAQEPVRVILVDGSNRPIARGFGLAGTPLRVEIEQ
jgi:hypothetical protein